MKQNPLGLLCVLMATIGVLLPVKLVFAAGENSCECPKLDCGSCMEEQGLTFYSEKCGPDNSQVKSCARPTCVALENAPPSCADRPKAMAAETAPASKTAVSKEERGAEIASIKSVVGSAWLKMPDGTKVAVAVGMAVFEKDIVQTEEGGKAALEFKDGNLIFVQSSSAMKVNQYDIAAEKRKAVLDLLKGQIRNQVKQKYNGDTTSYKVRTKTAVAGVRGTDFLVTYNEGEKVETEIKTLEGKVVLASQDYSQSLEVEAGQQASYVVAANNVFGEDDISEFVARGYMTPVYKMSEAEVRQLSIGTLVGKANSRDIASAKRMICNEPKAELNQCLWRCENNPKGEKACRTDMPEVSCVRKRCNANGLWAEETRLPAAFKEQCPPNSYLIKPCDY